MVVYIATFSRKQTISLFLRNLEKNSEFSRIDQLIKIYSLCWGQRGKFLGIKTLALII